MVVSGISKGKIFKIMRTTVKKLITAFMKVVAKPFPCVSVQRVLSKFKKGDTSAFQCFKSVCCATDVRIQQTNRPYASMEEAKVSNRKIHKLFGYRSRVSVHPNAQAVGFMKHCAGKSADRDNGFKSMDFHQEPFREKWGELKL